MTTDIARRPGLGAALAELELVAGEIEDADGEVSNTAMERFRHASLAVKERVDSWINYVDAAKALVYSQKDRRDRAEKSYRAAQSLEKGLKQYLKFQLEQHPNVPFKGGLGTLYLHKSPKALKVVHDAHDGDSKDLIAIRDVTVRGVVNDRLYDLDPSLRNYVRTVSYEVLDREKLRADLEAGMKLPWASIDQGSHIRIKG